ncbi:MAG: FAD-dependent oxidoreductase, partial [Halobacteriovoraceae bacterium]|nr:FAD-dependent oxidoreductase [Halobacteriovoraceae bacterium]
MAMEKNYDAIVIGAGMSGLAAAIRLSLLGKKICLLEKHSKTGGLNSYFSRGSRNLDTGLHALTNYFKKKENTPLRSILKQLRIPQDSLELYPQNKSRIVFPRQTLNFTNDINDLKEEISQKFPRQINGFNSFLKELPTYAQAGASRYFTSTKLSLKKYMDDPLLCEMLCYPVYSYGNAREDDMNYSLFSILFRSIYLEGLARPAGGIRPLLRILQNKLEQAGGVLKLRTPVDKINITDNSVRGITLKSGESLSCKSLYSSIGLPETYALAQEKSLPAGNISFAESIFFTREFPAEIGFSETMIFYNDASSYRHEMPCEAID